MRLHYLHLPHYGPLKKLRCVFRQNTLLPGRYGAVNFVVGVNGTGKSSLLRALYHTFQCLEHDEPPPLGDVFLPYHRQAFGPLEIRARRSGAYFVAEIGETSGVHSPRRNSLCRVFKLADRWSSRLADINQECDEEFDGWPNLVRRLGGTPDVAKLRADLAAREADEKGHTARKESALLRASYFKLLYGDAVELRALSFRLGLAG